MTFPDSLSANIKKFFEGLNNGFEQFIPVIGGLSADNIKMVPELNFRFVMVKFCMIHHQVF